MSEQPQQPSGPAPQAPGQPPYGQPPYGQPPYGAPQQQQYGGPPQGYARPLSPQDERTWGLVAHLSWLAASLVVLPFLGPLVVFLVLKDRSRFVREHAAEALNMNISLIAYEVALFLVITVLTIVTFGIGAFLYGAMAVPGVVFLVFSILGAVAASQGRAYRYPLIFRLVR